MDEYGSDPLGQEGNSELEEIRDILCGMTAAEEESELLWAFVGLLIGLGLSLMLLSFLGKVSGLSGPGINSGLAALGSAFGGGMLAGLCLLLVHTPFWSVGAFFLARTVNRRHAARAEREAAASLRALYGKRLKEAPLPPNP